MRDKRYPTRMHELLGVEPGDPFKIIGSQCIDDFCISIEGRLQHADNPGLACCRSDLEYAINNGITRRPRLTEEQVKRLRALIALEAMYLAKNKDGSVGAFVNKPTKNALYWNTNDSYVFYLSIVGTCLSELVSWEDPEPLDIVQVLRDAGVEVDDG